jgi:hypothetical protein
MLLNDGFEYETYIMECGFHFVFAFFIFVLVGVSTCNCKYLIIKLINCTYFVFIVRYKLNLYKVIQSYSKIPMHRFCKFAHSAEKQINVFTRLTLQL